MRTHVTLSDGTSIAVRGFGGPAGMRNSPKRNAGLAGEGYRTILLLHGLMGRASTWWTPARWLADHGRVIGLDARGHGDSPATGPWRTERFVADLVEVIEKLELGRCVVIGHSMGGLHGWELAAARPDLVEALVVEDMAPDHTGRTADTWTSWFAAMPPTYPSVAAVRDAFGYPRPSWGDYLVECVREGPDGYRLLTDPHQAGDIASEWGVLSFWDGVRGVRCPTLLLQAEESVIASEQMAEMAQVIPGARHVLVPGTGHLLHDDAPERYRELVTEFLNGLPTRGAL